MKPTGLTIEANARAEMALGTGLWRMEQCAAYTLPSTPMMSGLLPASYRMSMIDGFPSIQDMRSKLTLNVMWRTEG